MACVQAARLLSMIAAPKFFGCAHEDLGPEMSRVPLGIPTWPGATSLCVYGPNALPLRSPHGRRSCRPTITAAFSSLDLAAQLLRDISAWWLSDGAAIVSACRNPGIILGSVCQYTNRVVLACKYYDIVRRCWSSGNKHDNRNNSAETSMM